ncbi:MAG: hypothetical protein OEQ39_04240 [Gammaproteobacteria bacterium]|nr:hypothetical protein [Gammaproteobacteria bacterium]
MSAYLSVDPDTRIISITKVPVGGLSSLDAQIDIYSDLKEDWQSTPALQGLRFPLRSFGDPKTPTQAIGPYMFVDNANGWRFQPYDADHELLILGNLVPEDVTLPVFIGRTGRSIVITQEQTSQALTEIGSAVTLQDKTDIKNLIFDELVANSEDFRTAVQNMLGRLGLDKNNPLTTNDDNSISFGTVSISAVNGATSTTQTRDT